MPRNLYQRVEVMFPIKDGELRKRIFDEILQTYLKDTDKTCILLSDGSYGRTSQAHKSKPSRNGNSFNAQAFFVYLAEGENQMETASDETSIQKAPNVTTVNSLL